MQAARDSEQAGKQKASAREAALLEHKIGVLLTDKGLLGKVIDDTVGNIEKKQARTYEEMQAEQAEAEEVLRAALVITVPWPCAAAAVMQLLMACFLVACYLLPC